MNLQTMNADSSLEDIITGVETLLAINDDNLDAEATRQVKIFPQIARLHMLCTRKLESQMLMMEKIKHERRKRYLGTQTSEHYAKEPLREAVLKTEVDAYLKIDPVLNEYKTTVNETERKVKFLEDAKSQLKERGFLLRTALDFRKMILGV